MRDLIFAVAVVLSLAVAAGVAYAVIFRKKISKLVKLGDIYIRLPKHRVRIRRKRKLPPPFDALVGWLDKFFEVKEEETPVVDKVPLPDTIVVNLDPYFYAQATGKEGKAVKQSVDWLPFRIGSDLECEFILPFKSVKAKALELRRLASGVAVIVNRSSTPAYVYENAVEKVRIGRRGYPIRELSAPTAVSFGDVDLTLTPTPKYAQMITAPAELVFTVVNRRKTKATRCLIAEGESFTLGRSDECDMAFANPTLARRQLILGYSGEHACFHISNQSEHANLYDTDKRPLLKGELRALSAGDVFYMAGRDIELRIEEAFCPGARGAKKPMPQRTSEWKGGKP